MKTLFIQFAIALGLLCVSSVATAKTATQVFTQVSPSVVVVLSDDAKGNSLFLGSGVAVPGSLVVTNCHVVVNGGQPKVRYAGHVYTAELKFVDLERDVCGLSVKGLPAPPATLGSTRTLTVGATVYAIGAPEGLELSLTEGIVSSLRKEGSGRYIQTTAAISHGSSGGGLFDDEGNLLGLTSFYLKGGEQLNFALPVEWVASLPQRSAQFQAWAARVKSMNDQSAVTFARLLIKADPDNIVAWHYIFEYSPAGKEEMTDAAKHETEIGPQYESTWLDLAHAYNDESYGTNGDSDELLNRADDAYKEALAVNPWDANVWDSLAKAYMFQAPGDGSGPYAALAIAAAKHALTIAPSGADEWHTLGSVYLEFSELPQATAALQHALQLNPKNEGTWDDLMVSYIDAGDWAHAITAGSRVLQLNSHPALNHHEVACQMANAYIQLDEYSHAFRMYQRVTAAPLGQDWAKICNYEYPTLESTLRAWAKRAGVPF